MAALSKIAQHGFAKARREVERSLKRSCRIGGFPARLVLAVILMRYTRIRSKGVRRAAERA